MFSLTIYFKINLYKFIGDYLVLGRSIIFSHYFKSKFISKYLVLGRPIIFSHYFKSNFRLSKFICKENTDLLKNEYKWPMMLLITAAFDFFPVAVRIFFLLWEIFLDVGIFFLLWGGFLWQFSFFWKNFFCCCKNFLFLLEKVRNSYPKAKQLW